MRGRVISGRCSGGLLEDGCALWLGAARQLAAKNPEDGGAVPGVSWWSERRKSIVVRPFHASGCLPAWARQCGGLGGNGVRGSRAGAGGPQRRLVLGLLLPRWRWWWGCGSRCRRLPGHVVDAGRDERAHRSVGQRAAGGGAVPAAGGSRHGVRQQGPRASHVRARVPGPGRAGLRADPVPVPGAHQGNRPLSLGQRTRGREKAGKRASGEGAGLSAGLPSGARWAIRISSAFFFSPWQGGFFPDGRQPVGFLSLKLGVSAAAPFSCQLRIFLHSEVGSFSLCAVRQFQCLQALLARTAGASRFVLAEGLPGRGLPAGAALRKGRCGGRWVPS
ncbi:hypothetical protein GHT09_019384 [Marmota monax]|uniref:Uncharacterized protein n=1 Tax=Marmota monax TaxID=9995 RepID=A0A834PPJ2_MARMO|nr:hypothetical protein GHT09_019384 [Marmota monax]